MKPAIIKKITLIMLICMFSISINVLYGRSTAEKRIAFNQKVALNKANIAYQNYNYSIAAGYYETYLQQPSKSQTDELVKLADCYWQMRSFDQAFRIYKILYPAGSQGSSKLVQHRMAELYARNDEYVQASNWLKGVEGYALKANAYNEKDSLEAMKKDSLNWKLSFLNVNTSYREFSPFIASNTLFFSSNKPFINRTKSSGWDGDNFARLWSIPLSQVNAMPLNTVNNSTCQKKYSKEDTKVIAAIYECGDDQPMKNADGLYIQNPYLKGDKNSKGSIVKGLNNLSFNAGNISIDKNDHIYYSANYSGTDGEGVNRIHLMEGVYSNEKVTKIHNLPFGDKNSYSVMHPAINREGTFLVCSSDKETGKGGFDLYYATRENIKNPWGPLKQFPDNINTVGNEVFPSLTLNGYLYFSSDGMPGLGGLDIFRIPLKDALAGIGIPEHLSYPVNSSGDDFGWTQQDSTGIRGFFTSDRLNSEDNIYSFSDELALRAPKKSFIEGYVLEKKSKYPIKSATVFLYNLKNDSVFIAKTDNNGKYHIPVLNTSEVIIKAIDKKHFNDCLTSHVTYVPQPKDTIQKAPRPLLLDEFKVGFVWILRNIHYDFDKWNIRKDAEPILDSLVAVLNEQPITVELDSHTDSRGTFQYNDRLAEQRAKSSEAYLIKHGIDPKRITSKSFGKRQLLNSCVDGVPCSEVEHQANRRTEVKVTGYTEPKKAPEDINPDLYKDGDRIAKKVLPIEFFNESKMLVKSSNLILMQ